MASIKQIYTSQNPFVDDRIDGVGDAERIFNFRLDEDHLWANDRGWEPLIVHADSYGYLPADFAAYRFFKIWSRHDGNEVYYLYERDGTLGYDYANATNGVSAAERQLNNDRHQPKASDPGTQMVPFNRWALLMNGVDEPIKFWGRDETTPFSWRLKPSPPIVLNIQPSYHNTSSAVELYADGELATATRIPESQYYGINIYGYQGTITLSYKVSFISDTGSESPASDETVLEFTISTTAGQNLGCYVSYLEIPVGPDNTVARRIYRTGNKSDSDAPADGTYYLVAQIDDNTTRHYMDYAPDNLLFTQMPSTLVVVPHTYKYGTEWDGRCWIAGGTTNPTKIIYSETRLPEQFPYSNYFELGSSKGGHITALVPYYDVLIVFRENAINIISQAPNGGYTSSVLDPIVGTTATNTVKMVPGLGLLFLSYDGVYSLSGSLRGGSSYEIKKISNHINNFMSRLSRHAMPRATATYSAKENEYWCHLPVDGSEENTFGVVFHLAKGYWSYRGVGSGYDVREMMFQHLDTDPGGWIVIAPQSWVDSPNIKNIGLQVWSAAPNSGVYLGSINISDGVYTGTHTPRPLIQSLWESRWLDLGDDAYYKQPKSIELTVIAQGDTQFEIDYCKDHKRDWIDGGLMTQQMSDIVGTSSKDAVYGEAVWDTAEWAEPRVIRLRWDLNPVKCKWLKFRVVTTTLVRIMDFTIHYDIVSQKNLNQRGPAR